MILLQVGNYVIEPRGFIDNLLFAQYYPSDDPVTLKVVSRPGDYQPGMLFYGDEATRLWRYILEVAQRLPDYFERVGSHTVIHVINFDTAFVLARKHLGAGGDVVEVQTSFSMPVYITGDDVPEAWEYITASVVGNLDEEEGR